MTKWLLGAALLVTRLAAATPTVVTDDDSHWQVDLPEGWTTAEPPELTEGKGLAAWSSGRDRVIVARMRGNTDSAYEGKASYFAGLEEGVQKEATGYRRLAATQRKLGKKKKLPVYDLWYRSAAGVRGIRFIFLKSYTVLLSIDVPEATRVGPEARRILESFGPAKTP